MSGDLIPSHTNDDFSPLTDTAGRPWALVAEIKAGSVVEMDNGFPEDDCGLNGKLLTVEADEDGDLYVNCNSGKHLLDGQSDDGVVYVGVYHVKAEEAL